MHDVVRAIILGIVQGLTEFIPVSSTGHLIIAGELLEFSGSFAKTFDIAIQLGSIMAVVIIYKDHFREYLRPKPNLNIYPNIFHIAITLIPVVIIGYLTHDAIKKYLFSPFTVAVGLILGSFLMIFADYYHKHTKKNEKIGYKNAFLVGIFQCFALWPGMSRSGSTISGGILTGMDHKSAASYSFICAVPVMLMATVFELYKNGAAIDSREFMLLWIGFVVAFVVGWASIVFLLKLLSKIKLFPFAIYRIILAILILASSMGGKSA
jgi:undecaprenyl-diphosphatase